MAEGELMETGRFALCSHSPLNLAAARLVVLASAVLFWPHTGVSQKAAIQKLTLTQVEELVSHRVPDSTMRTEIQRRGLAFAPNPAIVDSLRAKGAGPLTLAAIEGVLPKITANKFADSGPSLAATMLSIQHLLEEQHQVNRVRTQNLPSSRTTIRETVRASLSDVLIDPATCILHATNTSESSTKWSVNGTDSVSHFASRVEITFSFKDVEELGIEKEGDYWNHRFAELGHPSDTMTVLPSVFIVHPSASKPAFFMHNSTTMGNQPPEVKDSTTKVTSFYFRDEATANRAVEVMRRAATLCRGGNRNSATQN